MRAELQATVAELAQQGPHQQQGAAPGSLPQQAGERRVSQPPLAAAAAPEAVRACAWPR